MKNTFIILYVVIIDQATKYFAVVNVNWKANTGISFGIFPSFPLWVFFVMIFVMLFFKMQSKTKLDLGWSLFMAGMIGNLIDRILLSYVVDWIPFPFPFIDRLYINIADIALIMGFICIFANNFKRASNDQY